MCCMTARATDPWSTLSLFDHDGCLSLAAFRVVDGYQVAAGDERPVDRRARVAPTHGVTIHSPLDGHPAAAGRPERQRLEVAPKRRIDQIHGTVWWGHDPQRRTSHRRVG